MLGRVLTRKSEYTVLHKHYQQCTPRFLLARASYFLPTIVEGTILSWPSVPSEEGMPVTVELRAFSPCTHVGGLYPPVLPVSRKSQFSCFLSSRLFDIAATGQLPTISEGRDPEAHVLHQGVWQMEEGHRQGTQDCRNALWFFVRPAKPIRIVVESSVRVVLSRVLRHDPGLAINDLIDEKLVPRRFLEDAPCEMPGAHCMAHPAPLSLFLLCCCCRCCRRFRCPPCTYLSFAVSWSTASHRRRWTGAISRRGRRRTTICSRRR